MRLSDWRIRILKERVRVVEEYIAYRESLDKRLREKYEIEDWLVKGCLQIRRLVNRHALGYWLRSLEIRKRLWESKRSQIFYLSTAKSLITT